MGVSRLGRFLATQLGDLNSANGTFSVMHIFPLDGFPYTWCVVTTIRLLCVVDPLIYKCLALKIGSSSLP